MEKTWEDFWTTGKVTDYLSYRNSVDDRTEVKKEQEKDGTVSCVDRDGLNGHAY